MRRSRSSRSRSSGSATLGRGLETTCRSRPVLIAESRRARGACRSAGGHSRSASRRRLCALGGSGGVPRREALAGDAQRCCGPCGDPRAVPDAELPAVTKVFCWLIIRVWYAIILDMAVDTVSAHVQDYAKAVYALESREGAPVATTELAERLGVTPG